MTMTNTVSNNYGHHTTTSLDNHHSRYPHYSEYRRASIRSTDTHNLAYSRINYPDLSSNISAYPDQHSTTSPNSSSSSSSSSSTATAAAQPLRGYPAYQSHENNYETAHLSSTTGGFIGGIPVTPIQVFPPSRTPLYATTNPPPQYTLYPVPPQQQAPQQIMVPPAYMGPSPQTNEEEMLTVPVYHHHHHNPPQQLSPYYTVPPNNNPTMVSPPIPWNALPVIQYSSPRNNNTTITNSGGSNEEMKASSSASTSTMVTTTAAMIPTNSNNNNNSTSQILTSPTVTKPAVTTVPPPEFASPFQTHRLLLRQTISRIYKRSRERALRRYFQRWYDNAHAITVQIQSRQMARKTQDVKGASKLVTAMDKIALRQGMRKKHSAFTKWYTYVLKLKAREQSEELENRAEQEMNELRTRMEEVAKHESIAKSKAEQGKQQAEEEKYQAEEAKRQAEQKKIQAEEEKLRAEEAKRHAEEAKRQAEEIARKAEEEKWKSDEAKRKAEEEKRKVEVSKQKLEKEKLSVEQSKTALEEDNKHHSKVAQEARVQASRFSTLFRISVCGMIVTILLLVLFISVLFPILLSSSNQKADLWTETVTTYPWIRYIVDIQHTEPDKQRCVRILTFRTPVCISTYVPPPESPPVVPPSTPTPPPQLIPATVTTPTPLPVDNPLSTTGSEYTVTVGGEFYQTQKSTVGASMGGGNFATMEEEEDWCSSPFGTCGLENVAM